MISAQILGMVSNDDHFQGQRGFGTNIKHLLGFEISPMNNLVWFGINFENL